jgi:hypothetical protein
VKQRLVSGLQSQSTLSSKTNLNSLILFEVLIVGFANIPVLLTAKALNASNAKYIIAGYNTMSDSDRQKIDVKRLVSSTKIFLYLLSTFPFLAFVILITTSGLMVAVGGYCLVVIVLICWFFVFTKKTGLR